MTEKSLNMADHFPCILMDFMQWYTSFQGHTAMLAQEFCDETDILSWQRKNVGHLWMQSLRNHMVGQKWYLSRNGGKSTIMRVGQTHILWERARSAHAPAACHRNPPNPSDKFSTYTARLLW